MKKFIYDFAVAMLWIAYIGVFTFGLLIAAVALSDVIPLTPGVVVALLWTAGITYAAVRLLIRELRGDDD